MADDYTVRLDFDLSQPQASVNKLIDILARLNSQFDSPQLKNAERNLAQLSGTLNTSAKATTAASGASQTLSSRYSQLYKQYGTLNNAEIQRAKAVETSSSQTAIYNKYLADEATAQNKAATAQDKSIGQRDSAVRSYQAYIQKQKESDQQLEIASKQTALYNQYLYDQDKALQRNAQSLSTTRYALYSASNTLGILGAALVGLAALPAKTAIEFERSFANVTRTVQGASAATETALISLSQSLPVSFKDLADIATLGGQLGEGSKDIIAFTKTVAELTATTNLSADVAGTALGRFQSFGLVTSAQFENLASSILKVGVNSVATETQIVTIATRIAGISKVAGLTADQVVGLSGAIASVGVQPYAAQGTVIRLFTSIGSAVSSGSDSLKAFAKVAGVSSDQFAAAYGTSKFGPIFEKFIENLGDTAKNGKDVNGVLADLGINGSTDIRTLTQLAAASGTVRKAFADAASGFADTSTLTKQYGIIADTTASKIKILQNSFDAFLNAIGTDSAGILKGVVGNLTDLVKGLTDIASNPVTAGIASVVSILLGLAGAASLVGAVALRSYAGLIGLTQGLIGLKTEGVAAGGVMRLFRTELETTGAAGIAASRGIGVATIALKGLAGIAAIVAAVEIGQFLSGAVEGTKAATLNFNAAKDAASQLDKYLLKVGNDQQAAQFGGLDIRKPQESIALLASLTTGFSKFATQIPLIGGLLSNAIGSGKAADAINNIDGALADLVKGGQIQQAETLYYQFLGTVQRTGQNSSEFAKEFKQYQAAMKAFQEATTGANDALNGTGEATFNVVKTLTALTGLDAKTQEGYASAYAKSVSALTDFNNIVGQVQDAQKAANKNYDGSSVSLQQFTDQLKSNNDAQTTWAQNLITLSTEVPGQAGSAAVAGFVQAGYSVVNASLLQQLVDATPEQRDAYIEAQVQSAQLAGTAMAQAILLSGYITTTSGGQVGADTAKAFGAALGAGVPVEQAMKDLGLRVSSQPQPVVTPRIDTGPAQYTVDSFINANNGKTVTLNVRTLTNGVAGVRVVGGTALYASGGHVRGTGTGTSDSIPARLSNGEYVIRAASVRQYGTGLFDQLNRGMARFAGGGPVRSSRQPVQGFANGGAVSGGGGMGVVELGPKSLGVLRQAVMNDISVQFSDIAIAQSNRRGQKLLSGQGAQL